MLSCRNVQSWNILIAHWWDGHSSLLVKVRCLAAGEGGAYLPTDKGVASARVYCTILAAYAAKKDLKVYFNFNAVQSGYDGWNLCDIETVILR